MSCTLTINIPFVLGRCDYYGSGLLHNVIPANKHAYLNALIEEARITGPDVAAAGEVVDEVVFANGALGTIEPSQLHTLLHELRALIPLTPHAQLTAEVDPGLISTALVNELRMAGLSCLRFHYFTSDALESERLERPCAAIEMPKTRIVMDSAGFHVFDMQILVGFSGQSEKTLLKTLRDGVLTEGVEHCTLVEAKGPLALESAEEKAALTKSARDFLTAHGFAAYTENCFAKRSAYQLTSEIRAGQGGPCVGLGAGASSRLGGLAWTNVADAKTYTQGAGKPELITASVREIG